MYTTIYPFLLAFYFCVCPPLQAHEGAKAINETTGAVFSDLQAAIDAAGSGETLRLKGTFIGPFFVAKDLTLKGFAVLDGAQAATVLTISSAHVTLENLTVQMALQVSLEVEAF